MSNKPGCPHTSKAHCPLYIVAHVAGLSAEFGCDDGQISNVSDCATSRTMDYHATIARLRERAPELVRSLERRSLEFRSTIQRQRNLRLNGLR